MEQQEDIVNIRKQLKRVGCPVDKLPKFDSNLKQFICPYDQECYKLLQGACGGFCCRETKPGGKKNKHICGKDPECKFKGREELDVVKVTEEQVYNPWTKRWVMFYTPKGKEVLKGVADGSLTVDLNSVENFVFSYAGAFNKLPDLDKIKTT